MSDEAQEHRSLVNQAVDEYGELDERIKKLTARKEKLRANLLKALMVDASNPDAAFLIEADSYSLEVKSVPGALRLSEELLKDDGIDTSQYKIRGKPSVRFLAKRRGQAA